MADVFLSYVSEDRASAEKISRGLEGAGFSVWWDRHIHGGVNFSTEIQRQLDAARIVVVLWSAASLDSTWVRDEAQQARDENKLIPVRLDQVQPPLGFRQTQSLDFGGWDGDPNAGVFAGLVASARHFLGDGAPAPPVQPTSSSEARRSRLFETKTRILAAALTLAVIAGGAAIVLVDRGFMSSVEIDNGRVEIHDFELLIQGDDIERFSKGLTDTIGRVFATNEIKTVVHKQGATEKNGVEAIPSEFIVHGTIDRHDGMFVVSADVLHRREGLVLWSKTMTQDNGDVAQFQQLFSVTAAGVLDCALRYRRLTNDDPSVDLLTKLLRYCDVLRSGDDNAEQLPELGRRLVVAAPQYGIFHGLHAAAFAYVTTLFPLRRSRPPEEMARLRKAAYASAKTAMEVDPRQMSGLVDWVFAIIVDPSRDLAERERLLQRSLSSDPAFGPLYYYGIFLERVGRTDDARTYYLRAGNEFPLSAYPPLTRAAELAAAAGAMFMAGPLFTTIAQTWPTEGPRFWSEFWYGDPAIAKQLAHEERYAHVIRPSQRRCVDAFLDARVKRIDLDEDQIRGSCGPEADVIEYNAYFGHVDAAYRGMEVNAEFYSTRYWAVDLFMPTMRVVRADARFMPFVARVGLVDYWLDSGHWPDFCTTEKLAYDCKEAARAARVNRVLLTPWQ